MSIATMRAIVDKQISIRLPVRHAGLKRAGDTGVIVMTLDGDLQRLDVTGRIRASISTDLAYDDDHLARLVGMAVAGDTIMTLISNRNELELQLYHLPLDGPSQRLASIHLSPPKDQASVLPRSFGRLGASFGIVTSAGSQYQLRPLNMVNGTMGCAILSWHTSQPMEVSGLHMRLSAPYAPKPSYTFANGSFYWHSGNSGPATIFRYDHDARPASEIQLPIRPKRVTDTARRMYIERLLQSNESIMRRNGLTFPDSMRDLADSILSNMPSPRFMPTISEMRIAADGRIATIRSNLPRQLEGLADSTIVDLWNSDGSFIGRVLLPPNSTVIDYDGSRLVATRHERGVQIILIYRVVED